MARTWSSEAGALLATGDATRSATVSRHPDRPARPELSVLGMCMAYPPSASRTRGATWVANSSVCPS